MFTHRREFEPVGHILITGYRDAVYGFMPPLGGGLCRFQAIRLFYGGGMGVCLLSSFLLLRIKYVRYLMAFWWRSFISFLMLDLGIFKSVNASTHMNRNSLK